MKEVEWPAHEHFRQIHEEELVTILPELQIQFGRGCLENKKTNNIEPFFPQKAQFGKYKNGTAADFRI